MQKKMLSLSLSSRSVCLKYHVTSETEFEWQISNEKFAFIYLAFPSVAFICCVNYIGVILSCCQGKENKAEDRNEKSELQLEWEWESEEERERER